MASLLLMEVVRGRPQGSSLGRRGAAVPRGRGRGARRGGGGDSAMRWREKFHRRQRRRRLWHRARQPPACSNVASRITQAHRNRGHKGSDETCAHEMGEERKGSRGFGERESPPTPTSILETTRERNEHNLESFFSVFSFSKCLQRRRLFLFFLFFFGRGDR